MPSDRVRHNLRQTLSRGFAQRSITSVTAPTTEGHDLAGSTSPTMSGSVIEAKELITACHHHRHRRADGCLPCPGRYRRLIELYRDDFLAHFMSPMATASRSGP